MMCNKKAKTIKRKPKYGFFSCVRFIWKFIWRSEKKVAITSLLLIPLVVILNILNLYVPQLVLRELEIAEHFGNTVAVILGLLTTCGLFAIVKNLLIMLRSSSTRLIGNEIAYEIIKKQYSMDYYHYFDPKVQKMINRSYHATSGNGLMFFQTASDMVIHIVTFAMIGVVVSQLNPIILLTIVLGCLICYGITIWKDKKNHNLRDSEGDLINKKLNYITFHVGNDLNYGKDIRLFGLEHYLETKLNNISKDFFNYQEKLEKNLLVVSMTNSVATLVRSGVAYLFVIGAALRGEIDAAQFVIQ